MTAVTTGGSLGVVSAVGHTYDGASRRTSATYEDTLGQAYAYDAAGQLTHARVGIAQASQADPTLSPTHRYAYDDAGNRTQTVDFGQTVNYTTNAVNAYTALSGGGYAPPAPTYDARGNTLRLPRRDGGALDLAWTAFDRLASVNGSTLLRYDALGRLTWLRRPDGQGGNIDEVWSWSGWTLLNRDLLGAGGTLLEQYRYTWGPDLSGSLEGAGGVGGLLAIERATAGSSTWEIRHVHSDANGNVLCLTDAQGQPSARYRYDAFGNLLQAQDLDTSGWAARNLHRFSTKPEVGGTGLLYYGYRWYDPVTGRWPSRDPIEEAGGVNLYGFVFNGPSLWYDYLGLDPRGLDSGAVARNLANDTSRPRRHFRKLEDIRGLQRRSSNLTVDFEVVPNSPEACDHCCESGRWEGSGTIFRFQLVIGWVSAAGLYTCTSNPELKAWVSGNGRGPARMAAFGIAAEASFEDSSFETIEGARTKCELVGRLMVDQVSGGIQAKVGPINLGAGGVGNSDGTYEIEGEASVIVPGTELGLGGEGSINNEGEINGRGKRSFGFGWPVEFFNVTSIHIESVK